MNACGRVQSVTGARFEWLRVRVRKPVSSNVRAPDGQPALDGGVIRAGIAAAEPGAGQAWLGGRDQEISALVDLTRRIRGPGTSRPADERSCVRGRSWKWLEVGKTAARKWARWGR